MRRCGLISVSVYNGMAYLLCILPAPIEPMSVLPMKNQLPRFFVTLSLVAFGVLFGKNATCLLLAQEAKPQAQAQVKKEDSKVAWKKLLPDSGLEGWESTNARGAFDRCYQAGQGLPD
jgi:hypothetical protein